MINKIRTVKSPALATLLKITSPAPIDPTYNTVSVLSYANLLPTVASYLSWCHKAVLVLHHYSKGKMSDDTQVC